MRTATVAFEPMKYLYGKSNGSRLIKTKKNKKKTQPLCKTKKIVFETTKTAFTTGNFAPLFQQTVFVAGFRKRNIIHARIYESFKARDESFTRSMIKLNVADVKEMQYYREGCNAVERGAA